LRATLVRYSADALSMTRPTYVEPRGNALLSAAPAAFRRRSAADVTASRVMRPSSGGTDRGVGGAESDGERFLGSAGVIPGWQSSMTSPAPELSNPESPTVCALIGSGRQQVPVTDSLIGCAELGMTYLFQTRRLRSAGHRCRRRHCHQYLPRLWVQASGPVAAKRNPIGLE
jgi:hypothetical protein